MKRFLAAIVVAMMALLAAHAAPAHAYGDATCGTNDSGGNISRAAATGFYHNASIQPVGWNMTYGFDNCSTGSTVELVIAKSTDGGVTWTNIWDFDHVVTSSEHLQCGGNGAQNCVNNALTNAVGCSGPGNAYRFTVNTFNQQDRMRWSPTNC